MKVIASAPSNIALLKYMGKSDATQNLALNPSLSLTLDRLCTWVEFESRPDLGSKIEVLKAPLQVQRPDGVQISLSETKLSEEASRRMLRFLGRLEELLPQDQLRPNCGFSVRSGNTFPSGSGIASSASAFAALTMGYAAFRLRDVRTVSRAQISQWARLGSGSACRSIEGPVVEWNWQQAQPVDLAWPSMTDIVVLVSGQKKQVSSSDAHRQVLSSPLYEGRVGRVQSRLHELKSAGLNRVAQIVLEEALEMHSLFHTCKPPFSYFQSGTMKVLNFVMPLVQQPEKCPGGMAPWVTLDAGPNVHVIIQSKLQDEWNQILEREFSDLSLLTDQTSLGAQYAEV